MELKPAQASTALIDGLQLLAWLEPHCFAGRDIHFRAGAGIAPDSSLPWPHVEHTKAAEFNPLALAQGFLHAFKDSFHRQLSFGLGDTRLIDHLVDDIELYHLGQLSSN